MDDKRLRQNLKELIENIDQKEEELIQKTSKIQELDTIIQTKTLEIQKADQNLCLIQEKHSNIEKEIQIREKEVKEWEEQLFKKEKNAKEIISHHDEEIILNIGGTKFYTTKSTLVCQENLFPRHCCNFHLRRVSRISFGRL